MRGKRLNERRSKTLFYCLPTKTAEELQKTQQLSREVYSLEVGEIPPPPPELRLAAQPNNTPANVFCFEGRGSFNL